MCMGTRGSSACGSSDGIAFSPACTRLGLSHIRRKNRAHALRRPPLASRYVDEPPRERSFPIGTRENRRGARIGEHPQELAVCIMRLSFRRCGLSAGFVPARAFL